jgi:hypothetical protein
MTRNRPVDRVVTTTPATASSTASPAPTASGTTSQEGAAACPQPNQTNANDAEYVMMSAWGVGQGWMQRDGLPPEGTLL